MINVKYKIKLLPGLEISISILEIIFLLSGATYTFFTGALYNEYNLPDWIIAVILVFAALFIFLALWEMKRVSKDGKPPNISGLTWFISGVLMATTIIFVINIHTKNNSITEPAFRILKSDISLYILDDGTGKVIRLQTIKVNRRTDKIRETDFAASMPIRHDDFRWGIQSEVNDSIPRKIQIRPDEFDGELGMLTASITPALESGYTYIRTCTLTVPGAFEIAKDYDWFALTNNYDADTINVIIDFGSRKITPGKIFYSQINSNGTPIEKVRKHISAINPSRINWHHYNSATGDKYLIEWNYDK